MWIELHIPVNVKSVANDKDNSRKLTKSTIKLLVNVYPASALLPIDINRIFYSITALIP